MKITIHTTNQKDPKLKTINDNAKKTKSLEFWDII